MLRGSFGLGAFGSRPLLFLVSLLDSSAIFLVFILPLSSSKATANDELVRVLSPAAAGAFGL